ncbi:helix-turn-helix domain-containing protein [Serratia plymuthica]|uniref:helix-turn-helix domain-containing protein n=1 Tax=Serratia plymuthica TaxID=82996 RepID=UPI00338E1253
MKDTQDLIARRQEARQLLLTGEHRASEVAFIVEYESASRFNREYLRQFGAPPARDMQQIREAIDISTRTNRHD